MNKSHHRKLSLHPPLSFENHTLATTIYPPLLGQAVPEEVVQNLSGYIKTDKSLNKALRSRV